MLNKPKFMSPSTNIERCVVDLNEYSIPFSCIVDGNTAVTAWKIVVYRLSDNAKVFDTGEIELDTPFYPVDSKNRNNTFQVDLKKYMTKESELYYLSAKETYDSTKKYFYINDEGIKTNYSYNEETWANDYVTLFYTDFTNSKDAYCWSISLWGTDGLGTVSSEEVFYANSAPAPYDKNLVSVLANGKINLEENPVLTERKASFQSFYKQEEGIALKRYGWRITDKTTNTTILDTITKNHIYGTSDNILCEYNGFINGCSYLLELYFETQNGFSGIVKEISFSVEYNVQPLDTDFRVEAINSSSCVILDWQNLKTTEGVATEGVKFIENFPIVEYDKEGNKTGSVSAYIPSDGKITFQGNANSQIQISEDACIVLSFQLLDDKNTTILEMCDEDNTIRKSLKYISSTRSFIYTTQKDDEYSLTISKETEYLPSSQCWYIITLYSPTTNKNGVVGIDMKLVYSKVENFPLPSEDLYPSDNLYPYNGKWNKLRR